MGSEIVLVVCTANVCRSPFAELLLRAGLDPELGIQIESAGTHARDGDEMCELAQHDRTGPEWAARARSHVSRVATSELVDRSALILAASADVRSEIVRLNPQARDRTFTLREAAHRGARFEPRPTARHRDAVSLYIRHLDQARSMLAPVPSVRGWLRPRSGGDDAISIRDGHRLNPRMHRLALKEVSRAVNEIAGQLNRCGVPSESSAIARGAAIP